MPGSNMVLSFCVFKYVYQKLSNQGLLCISVLSTLQPTEVIQFEILPLDVSNKVISVSTFSCCLYVLGVQCFYITEMSHSCDFVFDTSNQDESSDQLCWFKIYFKNLDYLSLQCKCNFHRFTSQIKFLFVINYVFKSQ